MTGRSFDWAGFRLENAGVLVLVDSANSRRTELLVVPPGVTADRAERALTVASAEGNDQRAAEILDAD